MESPWQWVDNVLQAIDEEFDSLGQFLSFLFHNCDYSIPDPQSIKHGKVVSSFLYGRSKIGIGEIIELIYRHRASQPMASSDEDEAAFSSTILPADISNAQPSIFSWATQLVGKMAHWEILNLTNEDSNEPDYATQLRASMNRCAKNVQVVSWDHLGKFTVNGLSNVFKRWASVVFYLTEAMAAPTKHSVVQLQMKQPHPMASLFNFGSTTQSTHV